MMPAAPPPITATCAFCTSLKRTGRVLAKLFQVLFRRLLLLLILILFGCGKPTRSVGLAGSWIITQPFFGAVSFDHDGSYQIQLNTDDKITNGSYAIQGDKLTLAPSSGNDAGVSTYVVSSTSNDRLELKPVAPSAAKIPSDPVSDVVVVLTRVSTDIKLGPDTIAKARQAQASISASTESEDCLHNVKQLMLGVQMYSEDYDQVLPLETWQQGITPYVKSTNLFDCPTKVRAGAKGGYGFNQELVGSATAKVAKPEDAPVIFDADETSPNNVAPLSALPNPQRHPLGNSVGYLDGHVASIKS